MNFKFLSMNRLPGVVAAVCAMAAGGPAGLSAKNINAKAQALSKQLGPSKMVKSANPAEFEALKKRLIPVLEVLEASNRSNGPRPESLLETAYDFREDVGKLERMLTTAALLEAWREANLLGLFDEDGHFDGEIRRGRNIGGTAVFEYVVPPDNLPEGSNQLANLRVVDEKKTRAEGAELTHIELAYRDQLAQLVGEKERSVAIAKIENSPKLNSVGQTKEQAAALFATEMELAGEDAHQLPTVSIEGGITATPSSFTKGRWRVTFDVTNLSRYPTEITLQYYLVGITDKKRDHYLMMKGEETIQLRRSENREVEVFTKSEGSYKNKADDHDGLSKKERARSKVRYRGFAVRVKHEKGVATFTASDERLMSYIDPAEKEKGSPTIESLPVF